MSDTPPYHADAEAALISSCLTSTRALQHAAATIMPAGHQPAPGQPSTSTEGWHESADHIRWATPQALARRPTATRR